MVISGDGIEIGEPLRNFRGVLTGVPQEVHADFVNARPLQRRAARRDP